MSSFYEQYAFNTSPGPEYLGREALPLGSPSSYPVRFIAYYLPQFHPIPENNKWWGEGFTEWTNVTKALPRYVGHRQPNLPSDLGFYNLAHLDAFRSQAHLAKRAGIYGFCIHNYWFSGKQVLETPLNNLLSSPDIDLPFCLNWANENWTRRWDGSDNAILLKQNYAAGDAIEYAKSILPALRDPRYIRIDGRPLFMVYRPSLLPNIASWVKDWRRFFIDHGVGSPFLVMAQSHGETDPRPYGFDAAAGFPPHNGGFQLEDHRGEINVLDPGFWGQVSPYSALAERTLLNTRSDYQHFPGVCPRWDNEARKPGRGISFYGSSPTIYGKWLATASSSVAKSAETHDRSIVFINAWNEWAEGAYLEPDRHYGYAYLAETRRVLEMLSGNALPPRQSEPLTAPEWTLSLPQRTNRSRIETSCRKVLRRLFNLI